MTPGPLELTVLCLSAGTTAALVLRTASRWLVEPTGHPDKVPYRTLGRRTVVTGCGLTAAAAMAAASVTLPSTVLALWWVLAALCVPLAVTDAHTTWLPLGLTRLAWAAMGGALAISLVSGGWVLASRALAGAAVTGAVFWLVWRTFRRGIGFGDVRLAPLLGAATAAGSWSLLSAGLWLGSVAGAAYAVVRLVRRRTGPFAYAPAMLIGPYAAAVILRLW